MSSVLYFPDGNRRYAKKNKISLLQSYELGLERSIRLFSKYFLIEKKFENLFFVIYTYIRKDSSYKYVCQATETMLNNLLKDGYLYKNNINFDLINQINKFPKNVYKISQNLAEKNNKKNKRHLKLILGYSIEKDFEQALSKKPKNYHELKKYLTFGNLDLLIRNSEISFSKGPVYALDQTQCIQIDRLNPEVNLKDLNILWKKYCKIKKYKNSLK